MKVKENSTGAMTAAKNKGFFLAYNMKIVV